MSVAGAVSPAGGRRVGWIVGPYTDLLFFIGGALAGYALFFMHAGLGWNMITVWLVWYVFLDAPHFFGTYSRTYLDWEEMRRRRPLLLGSLAWLAAGPILLLVSFALYHSGSARLAGYHELPFAALFALFGLWAYWHVVRQHYGILALYKRKNNDVAPPDQWVDKTLLYVGLLAPFLAFLVRHPATRGGLDSIGLLPHSAAGGGPGTWERWVVAATATAVGLAALAFLVRQVWPRRPAPVNLPKVLFLLAVVPLHALVCYHPATLTAPIVAFSAFVTVFHDIQYHAIVWHYQRGRCHRPGVDGRRFGPAYWVSRSFFLYMGCAILTGVVGWYLGCSLGAVMGCTPLVEMHPGAVTLFGSVTLEALFVSLVLGVSMHHYFVDQYIWRPGRDAELRKHLALDAGPPPA